MTELGKTIASFEIPGTFPSKTMLKALEIQAGATMDWNIRKVENLYDFYLEAIKAGNPVYGPGKTGSVDYILKNSNYTISEVRSFLVVLYQLAKEGIVDVKYWNVPLQETRSDNPIKNYFSSIDKISGAVKWGSIALVAGTALYFTWPFIKKWRKSNG